MARRRRIAYRKKQQNRFSMFLVTLVVVMILVLVGVRSAELKDKIDVKRAEAVVLDDQIEAEKTRALEIQALEKEVQTKGYIEDVAREKLGLVYEDEILFKQDE